MAAGDVADYTTATKDEINDIIVRAQGVPRPVASAVTIEPGSVVVTTTLDYVDQEDALGAGLALSPAAQSAATMESFLRDGGIAINVTEAPTISARQMDGDGQLIYSYGSVADQQKRALWPIFVAVAGAGLFLLALALLIWAYWHRFARNRDTAHEKGVDEPERGASLPGRVALRSTTASPVKHERRIYLDDVQGFTAPPPAINRV
eukprot:scaffold60448_cov36-Tisochrysis_lutea.AAC.1